MSQIQVKRRAAASKLSAFALVILLAFPAALMQPAQAAIDIRWLDPLRLNSVASPNTDDVDLHVFANGAAIAVWTLVVGSTPEVRARLYTPALGWGVETTINNVSVGPVWSITLHLSGNDYGQAVAAWFAWNGTSYATFAATFDLSWGGAWSAPLQVSSVTGAPYFWEANPVTAINDNGDAAVLWMMNVSSGWNTSVARYNRSGAWSGEELVGHLNNSSAGDLTVAIDNARNVQVLFGENNGTDEFLWGARYSVAGGWTAQSMWFLHPDNGPSVLWTDYFQIGADGAGNMVAVGQVYNGQNGQRGVWGASYTAAGGWTAPKNLTQAGLAAGQPELRMRPDGVAYIVFHEQNWLHVFTWNLSTGFTLNWGTNPTYPGVLFDMEVSANGVVTVAWIQNIGGSNHINTRQYAPWMGGWGPVRQADSAWANTVTGYPEVGVDALGNAMVLWRGNNGSGTFPAVSKLDILDPVPMPLFFTDLWDWSTTGANPAVISGLTAPGASVSVNGRGGSADEFGRFAISVPLGEGWNSLKVTAVGRSGAGASATIRVGYADPTAARAKEAGERLNGFEGWTEVDAIEGSPHRYYSTQPRTAVNARGDAVVAWVSFDNIVFAQRLYAAVFKNGTGWEAPRLLENGPNGAFDFRLAISPQGHAVVTWHSFALANEVYAAVYDPASGWGPSMTISEPGMSAYFPEVAIGTTGEIFVVFMGANYTSFSYEPHVNRYIPGQGWTGATAAVDGCNLPIDMAVAVYGQNDVRLAIACSSGQTLLQTTRFTPATGWSAPVTINSSLGAQPTIVMALDPYGQGTLVVRVPKPATSIFQWAAARSDTSGVWGSLVAIENQTTSVSPADEPSVGSDMYTGTWVIWRQPSGGVNRVFANTFNVYVGGWSGESIIDNTTTTKNIVRAAVAFDGTVALVWHANVGSYNHVQMQRFDRTASAWQPVELVPFGILYSQEPAVGITSDGRPWVVFTYLNPTYDGLWMGATRFAPRTAPTLTVTTPANGSTVTSPLVRVAGTTEINASVNVNGYAATVYANNTFALTVPLVNGTNNITVVARDRFGNTATINRTVIFVDPVLIGLSNLNANDVAILAALNATNSSLLAALAAQNASLLAEIAAQNASLLGLIGDLNTSLLAEMAAGDAALAQLIADTNASLLAQLAAVNSDLLQDIADLNASLLADLAAGDAALAAQIASTNATLFAALAQQNSDLLDALAAQNASLLAEMAANDADLAALIADTNSSLLAQLAANDADLRDALAGQNASLLASLAAQNSSLLARIGATNASLLAELAATNATLMAQLTSSNGALWAALNGSAAAQSEALEGTNQSLTGTQDDLSDTQQVLAGANNVATIGAVLAAAGLAIGLLALMLARRRPPVSPSGPSEPAMAPPVPGGAEIVAADVIPPTPPEPEPEAPRDPSKGHSMASESELSVTGDTEQND